jgi:hypothetical protein
MQKSFVQESMHITQYGIAVTESFDNSIDVLDTIMR